MGPVSVRPSTMKGSLPMTRVLLVVCLLSVGCSSTAPFSPEPEHSVQADQCLHQEINAGIIRQRIADGTWGPEAGVTQNHDLEAGVCEAVLDDAGLGPYTGF
jgi:hypothetical protein